MVEYLFEDERSTFRPSQIIRSGFTEKDNMTELSIEEIDQKIDSLRKEIQQLEDLREKKNTAISYAETIFKI